MEFGPTFFVALAFVIFVAGIFKPVGKLLTRALDDRARKIKDELGEALRLKEEAQSLLASYQRKQREVVEQSAQIIVEAEKEAERIIKESSAELEEALNKRVEVAMQKIANYETAVIQQVKNNSVDIAISTVRSVIVENLGKDAADDLVGKAVADIGKKLH